MNYIINNYDLFIFDLDDTLIYTENYHYDAWMKTLKNNINNDFLISHDYFFSKFHTVNKDGIKNYLTNELYLDDPNKIISEKNNIYIELIKEESQNIKMVDGVEDLLKLIISNNKKFVIVSNSLKSNIDFYSDLFPILKYSSKNYYREMFQNKKPNPECYLSVVNDFSNERMIGFEDSITGIEALTQVKDITHVFINSSKYIHYDYIIKNYGSITIIKNYFELNNKYIENKIINTIRILSVDMVEKANSGHPGMPLGCAPMMFVLWCKIMNFDSSNPLWLGRDRFILSNGHGCALLYSMLYLLGYDYTIDDLKQFRQLNSKTPGHPEINPLLGIEISTGPLGQGIANGVGMAIASKKLGLKNNIYVMCGDGCLMEGISYEACSLAGHLGLNNLIILYDDNGITIDGETDITFTENVKERFIAQNWNILNVDDGNKDIDDIYEKIVIAKKSFNKPTIIFIKTTIGYGSKFSGKNTSHGSPLGIENTKNLKKYLGFDENKSFYIPDEVKEYFDIFNNNKKIYDNNIFLEDNLDDLLKKLRIIKNEDKSMATRDSSALFLKILSTEMNNIIIGSADLGESNKTIIKGEYVTKDNFNAIYLNYGIREHAMMSIANGISTYNILPIVSTFLVFITYCLASIRMAALSHHKVIYILTHDSILLGEDGPTHQPIESLTILRSIPNLLLFRPCDINEVSGSYQEALKYNGPSALILSRQLLQNIEYSDMNKIQYGGYVVYEPDGEIQFIIVATGSEVSLAIDIAKQYGNKLKIRVVTMPCTQLFDKQADIYKEEILPSNIKKMSLEAGSTLGWYKYVDYVYGIDTFGASGSVNDLKENFGFTFQKIINFIESINI